MKLLKFIFLTSCFSILPFAAQAHHQGDPIGDLLSQAQSLNYTAQSSWLQPNVKYAVEHFVSDISSIEDCVIYSPYGDHEDSGVSCRDEVYHVQGAWNTVARYLYDTNYDFPQVYNQYLQTQYAFQNAIRYMQR